jgi:hypothetical protein
MIKMNTRSQTRNNNNSLYEVDIDFDEASEAWRANKKHIGNGMFNYICSGSTKSGNKCNRQPVLNSEYCKTHKNKK